MTTRGRWPAAGLVLLAAAVGCAAMAFIAPTLSILGGIVIGVVAAVCSQCTGRARTPIIVTCAIATVLSVGMLLISLDPGSGSACPDIGCGEQQVPEPDRRDR